MDHRYYSGEVPNESGHLYLNYLTLQLSEDYASTSVAGSLAIGLKADPLIILRKAQRYRALLRYPLFRSVQVQIADIRE